MPSQRQNVVALFSWIAKISPSVRVLLFFLDLGRVPIFDFLAGMLMCSQSEPECSCAFQLEC